MTPNSIVITGAGHAGVQAAASLREEGWEGAITLLSDEAALPYQRPPLSKAFLKGQLGLAGLPLRAEKFFHDNRIGLRLGEKVLRIDRKSKRLELSWGGVAPYDHLILAIGARQRVLRAPGVDLEGVISLRTIVDAQAIREGLGPGRRVVVIGAGFIGLEIAATALALRGDVTILEIADRPLGRAVSPAMSSFFLRAHQAFGAKFRLGVDVTAIHGAPVARAMSNCPAASACPPTSSSLASVSLPKTGWRGTRASIAPMASSSTNSSRLPTPRFPRSAIARNFRA